MNVTNRQSACTPYTPCSADQYQSQPPTHTEDRVCSPLDSIATCNSEQYLVSQASQRVENLDSYHACMKRELDAATTYANDPAAVTTAHDACVAENSA
jgi:hypothetical protein